MVAAITLTPETCSADLIKTRLQALNSLRELEVVGIPNLPTVVGGTITSIALVRDACTSVATIALHGPHVVTRLADQTCIVDEERSIDGISARSLLQQSLALFARDEFPLIVGIGTIDVSRVGDGTPIVLAIGVAIGIPTEQTLSFEDIVDTFLTLNGLECIDGVDTRVYIRTIVEGAPGSVQRKATFSRLKAHGPTSLINSGMGIPVGTSTEEHASTHVEEIEFAFSGFVSNISVSHLLGAHFTP